MFSKTFFILAASLAGVRATCEWNGYGVGLEQFCNIGTPKHGSYCDELMGFVTGAGTTNMAGIKNDLSGPGGMCGDYSHGYTTFCDENSKVTGLYAPESPRELPPMNCHEESQVIPGSSSLGAAAIYYCCA
ncbi:hypothetical protein B0H16DRAFT_1551400 [Mycena metata]|uniref:Uncharacterized protein n=1 Tax=Mycena metata TaxID=1033252 RepID=A0AAD7N873_9AGAR|nr:hypothetical protein B0H16DRAFT_1551400 [Mycena metata]